jgi:hypothetical protein
MNEVVSRFLNESDQVKIWPKKHANKNLVLEYLIEKFDSEKVYSEKEVNEILNKWHTFQDWPLLRRSLVDAGLLKRDIQGYEYRRTKHT